MIKILTYNVEAQRFYRKEDIIKLGLEYYEWNDRLAKIKKIIEDVNADIICLQEVEIATFTVDYKSLTDDKYGYHGHPQPDRKRSSPIGNFILYRKSKFSATNLEYTSCAVIMTLKDLVTDASIRIANVHLKAGIIIPESISTRISQLKSVLKHKLDIICGDFNENFDTNKEIIKLVTDNGFIIHNKYLTCFTIDKIMDTNYWCFDNILTKDQYNVVIQQCPNIVGLQIPNELIPSDHIPLDILLESKN